MSSKDAPGSVHEFMGYSITVGDAVPRCSECGDWMIVVVDFKMALCPNCLHRQRFPWPTSCILEKIE